MSARVSWLVTSPRVAPGLLTSEAWDALRAAPVFAAAADHPQAAALERSAVAVTSLSGPPAEVAPRLRAAAPCTWLAGNGDSDLRAALGSDAVDIQGSRDLPGAVLIEAVAVMDRLRSPGGCPWDAEQTHASLAPYLLEETYEAYQAIEDGAIDTDLREELGDVLLQVLFHARLAEERAEPWSVDDVAAGLVAKLVGRHPHVFGDASVEDAAEVESRWDAIKAQEKGRTSVVDGVALGQPALSLAAKLVGRAGKAGLPLELPEARDGSADELVGRALFGVAARAKSQGIDPEAALRSVARAYADVLRSAELA